jgi:acyl carrier protein
MMPDQIFRLEEIPLTINGKIDFKNLPRPQLKKRAKSKVEPKTDMEKRLVSLWATYLDIEQPSVTDGFFEMGGDSLKAIRLVAMAEKDGVKFSLQDLYQYGTIRELAPHVVKITEASPPSHKEPREEDTFHVSEEDMSAILTALQ